MAAAAEDPLNNDMEGMTALLLDGAGGARELEREELDSWRPGQGTLWLHLNHESETARKWVTEKSGINEIVAPSLLAAETRPRLVGDQDTLMIVLRGVNLNPGANPEDMVAVRMWCEPERVITVSARRVLAVDDLRSNLERGLGPGNTGEFLTEICKRMLARIEPVITELQEVMYDIEDLIDDSNEEDFHSTFGLARRRILSLSRHLEPQREVALRLAAVQTSWLGPDHMAHLREAGDQTSRIVEQLNHLREWAALMRDEFDHHLSYQLNRTMYLLTVVATFLLPLTFVTGLMGVNLAGIPWAEHGWSFPAFVLIMVVLGVGEFIILYKLRTARKKRGPSP